MKVKLPVDNKDKSFQGDYIMGILFPGDLIVLKFFRTLVHVHESHDILQCISLNWFDVFAI